MSKCSIAILTTSQVLTRYLTFIVKTKCFRDKECSVSPVVYSNSLFINEISNFDNVIAVIDGDVNALRLLKTLHTTKSIPTIFLGDRSLVSKAYSLGAEDFLLKPLDLKLLNYKLNLNITKYSTRQCAVKRQCGLLSKSLI